MYMDEDKFKEKYPYCIKCDTVDRMQHFIDEGYDMTTREICQAMCAHRPWVENCITYRQKYLYISNGVRGDYAVTRNYAKIFTGSDAQKFYNRNEIMEIISRAFVGATRQTIIVPFAALVSPSLRRDFAAYGELIDLKERELDHMVSAYTQGNKEKIKWEEIVEEKEKLEKYMCSLFSQAGRELYRISKRLRITRRSDSERVPVDITLEEAFGKCHAASDIKRYGDTDEDVYRQIYRSGEIRLEYSFKDHKAGIKDDSETPHYLEKKLYLPPEDDWSWCELQGYKTDKDFLVHYADYLRLRGWLE